MDSLKFCKNFADPGMENETLNSAAVVFNLNCNIHYADHDRKRSGS